MSFLTLFAIFFIVWWVTLFAVLPIGVTHDAEDAPAGTAGSAPDRPRMGFKMLLTTVISILIVALFYVVTHVFGWDVDDLPRIVPEFSREAE